MKETEGEQCYRLFGDIINKYKHTFEKVEKEWKTVIETKKYLNLAYFRTLPGEYRKMFWDDTFLYYEKRGVDTWRLSVIRDSFGNVQIANLCNPL